MKKNIILYIYIYIYQDILQHSPRFIPVSVIHAHDVVYLAKLPSFVSKQLLLSCDRVHNIIITGHRSLVTGVVVLVLVKFSSSNTELC